MCKEYRGPTASYDRLGIEELWLPTADHFEPSVKDLERAVEFVKFHQALGNKVYIHCRAGHGRSAAAVFAWLLSKENDGVAPSVEKKDSLRQLRKDLNAEFCKIRDVRSSLWKQRNIIEFHSNLAADSFSSEL